MSHTACCNISEYYSRYLGDRPPDPLLGRAPLEISIVQTPWAIAPKMKIPDAAIVDVMKVNG